MGFLKKSPTPGAALHLSLALWCRKRKWRSVKVSCRAGRISAAPEAEVGRLRDLSRKSFDLCGAGSGNGPSSRRPAPASPQRAAEVAMEPSPSQILPSPQEEPPRRSPRPHSGSGPGRTYSLRPAFQHKFRPSTVKDCIHEVLKEELASVQYNPDEIPHLTKSLSETILEKLKEKGFHRYKMVVQVVIGEQRGEGVNMAARCFWDSDTDNYAQDIFMNDTLFCVVVAFGCFFY